MMRFQQSAKIPVSSESAVHGERRNDFLAVVLSWPTDAIQLRSLITHPDAHSETHIRTVDARTRRQKLRRRIGWDPFNTYLHCTGWNWGHICCRTRFKWKVAILTSWISICMWHAGLAICKCNVYRALQAFCSAHRWLQWAFAHHVTKITRQAQQMLHTQGLGFDER